MQKTPYRFIKRKGRNIAVIFSHIPGKCISTKTKDETEAILFAENFLLNQGLGIISKIPTLEEYAKDFFIRTDEASFQALNAGYKRQRREDYYQRQQAILDNYIIKAFGPYLINAITRKMIESWLITYKAINGNSHADATRNKTLICFRQVLDSAQRDGLIDRNVAKDVGVITAQTKERRALTSFEQRILFPQDAEKRIEIWGSLQFALYFSIIYDTGFRPGEVLGLKVCDIYKTRQGYAIFTDHSFDSNLKKFRGRVKTTGKGLERRVGLLDDVTATLALWFIAEERIDGDEQLFLQDRHGNRPHMLVSETTNKHFKSVCKSHEITDVVQYCLRHTYATERRGDLEDSALAISMGHTKLRDDYDHRAAVSMIRLMEDNRTALFANRERRDTAVDIAPITLRKIKG